MERKEEMATVAKNLKAYVRRNMVFPFKISCRLARDHPFILGVLISMHILHSYWPVLFDFLVFSSPVFICTALLLGALLVYGEPNISENIGVENRTKVKEISGGKQAEGTVKVREAGGSMKANKSDFKHQFDSSLGSSCQPLKGHDGSAGSAYDEAENSFPDASVADIIPMLDELHPILDSEAPRSSHLSVGNSDAASNNTSQDSESDYDRTEEEVKKHDDEDVMVDELRPILGSEVPQSAHLSIDNSDAASKNTIQDSESNCQSVKEKGKKQENEDIIPMLDELHPALDSGAPQPAHLSADNSDAASSSTTQDSESDYDSGEEEVEKEDEEAWQERDDANEAVVIWTEDDQKNLMDLVSSELERNQRLENLIAKRRAWNFLSCHAEKNFIGPDSNDHMPSIEDLPCLHYHSPSISAPRHNPFDLPFNMEETRGLPPFPSSAPALQPRHNPFDLPLDQDEESDGLARETMNHQKFAPASQREMFFRQHESFTLGASFSGDCKEDSLDSLLKPHSVHKYNSNASTDQDNHKDRLEEFNLDSRMISPESHIEPVQQDSQPSNVVDSVDEHEDVDDDHAIQLNSSTITEDNHQAADAFGAVEMEITQIRRGEPCSSVSQAGSLEVIEERDYDSSSSFSEAYETSSGSMLSVPAYSDITSASERLVDSQPVGPVYDSLFHAGNEFCSANLVASDVQLLSSDLASPSTLPVKVSSQDSGFASDSGSTDEKLSTGTTELWVVPPSLAPVDEIESSSKKVTEISKRDVIRVGLSGIHEDFVRPISPVLPEVTYPSCLPVDLSTDIAVGVDVITNTAASSNPSESALPYTAQEVPVFQHSENGGLKDSIVVTSDMSPISTIIPEDFRVRKELESIGTTKNINKLMPVFQSSEKAGLKESDAVTSYMSPFLMNNREDFRVRKMHESMIDPSANPSGLSGLQQIEEHDVGLSGEGDKLLPKSSSSSKIRKIKNMRKLMHGFHHFEKGGLKDSNVITSDVSTIPMNSLEVFRVRKESESVTDPYANASSLSGLQQIEELGHALSGQGDKIVSKSSYSLKMPKIKNIKKLMPVFLHSDKVRPKDFEVPEDFRVSKENKNISAPVVNSSSLSIDVCEVSLTGDGDKPVSKSSSSSSKIGKINKNVKKLMPVIKLYEKAGHKVSDFATSHAPLIPTNYSSEDVTDGKEDSPLANSSSSYGLQQIQGDKLKAEVSKSNSSLKIGKVKNIKKFW